MCPRRQTFSSSWSLRPLCVCNTSPQIIYNPKHGNRAKPLRTTTTHVCSTQLSQCCALPEMLSVRPPGLGAICGPPSATACPCTSDHPLSACTHPMSFTTEQEGGGGIPQKHNPKAQFCTNFILECCWVCNKKGQPAPMQE